MKPGIAELEARLKQREEFLERDSANPALLAECADLSLLLGRLDDAMRLVDAALVARPGDPYFRARKASVQIARGDFPSAIGTLEVLLQEGHRSPAISYNLAYALTHAGRYEKAEELLRGLADSADELPDAPALRVRVLHHLGKLDEAIALADGCVQRNPGDPVLPGLLAMLHHDANHAEEAKIWAGRALAANPASPEALFTSGALALEREEGAEARDYFERALGVNATSGRAWLGMGLSQLLGLDVNSANDNLARAVQCMPNHIGTWHALAWCQILRGDAAGARTSFDKAMELDHNFGETHGGLAVVAIMQGRFEEAGQAAERAVRLQPDSFSGRFAQLLLIQRSGRAVDMQAVLGRILAGAAAPGGGTLKDMLSRVALKSSSRKQGKSALH